MHQSLVWLAMETKSSQLRVIQTSLASMTCVDLTPLSTFAVSRETFTTIFQRALTTILVQQLRVKVTQRDQEDIWAIAKAQICANNKETQVSILLEIYSPSIVWAMSWYNSTLVQWLTQASLLWLSEATSQLSTSSVPLTAKIYSHVALKIVSSTFGTATE